VQTSILISQVTVEPVKVRETCFAEHFVLEDILILAFHFKYSLLSHQHTIFPYIELDILTTVTRKNSVFWDIMPCSPMKVNQFADLLLGFHFNSENGSDVFL
jgi:hypothetical protein